MGSTSSDPLVLTEEQWAEQVERLRSLAASATSQDEAREVTSRIAQISRAYRVAHGIGVPMTPAAQALDVDPNYVIRPHVSLLSERITEAVRDVENGQNRRLIVSMPPRSGKSTLTSYYTPLWLLRRHPEWDIMMTAHDATLSGEWARTLRYLIEDSPSLGIALKRDGGAGSRWGTVEGGGMYATSVGAGVTGRGAKVLVIDDPISDFVAAHSPLRRQAVWDWWLSTAQTRLEPPFLVIVTMTRWHEDDFAGRLLSTEHEGNPRDWEQIVLPALADTEQDALGRGQGQPLLSPLLDEDEGEALARWYGVKEAVGSYTFSAMYQQRPAPQKGAIFDTGWWRYWTRDPAKATDDGRIVYLEPHELTGARWIDSWDCSFKGGESGSWVVGQRWVRMGANRYLIAQQRGRWSFTQTIDRMERWAESNDDQASPCGHLVHERLIEDKANGPAIIDVLRSKISGIKPVNPNTSKEARARAVTPEIESGNVYLPHPTDDGNEWVSDLLSELRNFPHDVADDQVDTLTQALSNLRDSGRGLVTVPGRQRGAPGAGLVRQVPSNLAAAARTGVRRGAPVPRR